MGLPHPTQTARRTLAARFGLPYDDTMQDWEWEIADAARFSEFIAAYRQAGLNEAKRVSLMEILVQCVDDLFHGQCVDNRRVDDRLHLHTPPSENLPEWRILTRLLRRHASLHASTIDYWSCLDEPDLAFCFVVTGPMRALRTALLRRAG